MTYYPLSITELTLLIIVVLWALFWKALALWHAARRNDAGWFIAFLFINTVGLLEIFYLYYTVKLPALRGTKPASKKKKK